MAQEPSWTSADKQPDATHLDPVSPNRDGLPTGEGTSLTNDVADPHPSTEEHYDKIPHPGGTRTPSEPDIGPNSYAHDGTPQPRPKNVESGDA